MSISRSLNIKKRRRGAGREQIQRGEFRPDSRDRAAATGFAADGMRAVMAMIDVAQTGASPAFRLVSRK